MAEKPFEPYGLRKPKPWDPGLIAPFIAVFTRKGPSYEEPTENP